MRSGRVAANGQPILGGLGHSGDRHGARRRSREIRLDLDATSTLQDGLMSTTPAIRIAGLLKSYGDLEVLRRVDFYVAPGSIFALLGSNGAGRTTTIRLLLGLISPSAGRSFVFGWDSRVRRSLPSVASRTCRVRPTSGPR
jgi:ABC-type molybdenum transport system ATPase subunit/photorepair protein PhrA